MLIELADVRRRVTRRWRGHSDCFGHDLVLLQQLTQMSGGGGITEGSGYSLRLSKRSGDMNSGRTQQRDDDPQHDQHEDDDQQHVDDLVEWMRKRNQRQELLNCPPNDTQDD